MILNESGLMTKDNDNDDGDDDDDGGDDGDVARAALSENVPPEFSNKI